MPHSGRKSDRPCVGVAIPQPSGSTHIDMHPIQQAGIVLPAYRDAACTCIEPSREQVYHSALSTHVKAMSYNGGMRKLDKAKHSNNVTYRCHYHVVWCPKYRRKVITSLNPKLANPPIEGDPGPVDERLKQIIREVCKETGSEIVKLEVMPDRVHLIVDCAPQYGIHKLVRLVKARTSRLLRAEFPSIKRRLPSLWTNSYFVATVGREPIEIVEQYVQNQRNV